MIASRNLALGGSMMQQSASLGAVKDEETSEEAS
jgi:hypothetical protein